MHDADRPRFARALATLAEVFGESVSRERAEAYFAALLDLPIEAAEHAMALATRTQRFFPRPAELRDLLPSALPEASAAWTELQRALRATGSQFRVPALSPLLAETVTRLGGWHAVMTADNQDALWRRFERLYDGIRQATRFREGDPRMLPAALTHEAPAALEDRTA